MPALSTQVGRGRRRAREGAVLLLAGALASGQAPPEPPVDQPVFRAGTAVVLLDVLVRDKRGRSLADVTPEEIEVFEDGVRQKVERFRWVQTEAPTIEEGPAPDAGPAGQPNLVCLVFDQLAPDARRLAAKAANTFLEKAVRRNTWVSVFRIDQRLSLIEPFTNEPARLRRAVRIAASVIDSGTLDERAAAEQAQRDLEPFLATPGAPGSGAPAGPDAFAARAHAEALANILRLSTALQRQQLGTTSLYPLFALMRGHDSLAGRKTLVYFSEGLQVPPNLEAVFRSTISAANRANVSVYAIDARGLNVDRALAASADALDQARRVSQRAMESRGAGAVSKEEVLNADTAESALRLNLEQTLADLSESTGGFLVSNTNDFRQGAERLAADLSGHYELTYQPTATAYDGRFRRIEVKVARKGADVQTRSGYFALPPGESAALLPYEVPLLAALGRPEPPRDFEVRAAALHFAETPAGREHRLIVETRVDSLKMITDVVQKTYRLHFSLLALVKGPDGSVVERFSEDYPFQGPLERAEGLKRGNIVLKRRFTLPPGAYTLEVAGQDREVGRIGTVRANFEVPPPGGGPRTSSLTLIRRIEPVSARVGAEDDPLDVGEVRVVPNLDLPISVAANQKLSLFLIVYPRPAEAAQMTLEFWREGKRVARAEPALPAPEADGRIRYVGTFPIEKFTPGAYEARVGLSAAGGRSEERAAFTLVP